MKMFLMKTCLSAVFAGLAMLACMSPAAIAQEGQSRQHSQQDHSHADAPKQAVAVLMPTRGNKVTGMIMLRQDGDVVHVTGKVTNLSPGEHGFHIHEFGDLRSADGTSAGGHYAPEGHPHGGPDDQQHHAGDLGNITAGQDGVARVDKKSKGLKIARIMGRAVVVHQGADDFKSQPSGDAGPRVALGVIGFAQASGE